MPSSIKAVITHSSRQTISLGVKLAKELSRIPFKKGALVVALQGELGSGKTTFLQGFAKGLGIKEKILSPTFIILRKFEIRNSKSLPTGDLPKGDETNSKSKIQRPKTFYHIDAYRLKSACDLYELGWNEIIKDPQNIIVVEWADRVRGAMSRDAVWIRFRWCGEAEREIRVNKIN